MTPDVEVRLAEIEHKTQLAWQKRPDSLVAADIRWLLSLVRELQDALVNEREERTMAEALIRDLRAEVERQKKNTAQWVATLRGQRDAAESREKELRREHEDLLGGWCTACGKPISESLAEVRKVTP